MRLLTDENVPGRVVSALREAGHDVAWMVEDGPGTPDPDVLRKAGDEERVLVTFDTDFGKLIFQESQPPPAGLILFRLPPMPPHVVERIVLGTIASRDDWQGFYSVADERRIRLRRLPGA